MNTWQDYLAAHRDRFVAEYLDLLRIPSVSTLPEHKGDVQRAYCRLIEELGEVQARA